MKLLRRSLILALLAAIGGIFYWNAFFTDRVVAQDARAVTLLSRAHTIDRIYMSMQGPFSNHADIHLTDLSQRELLWITGIRAELVGRDGQSPISREFFCHSNLTFDPARLDQRRTSSDSPFTPSQDWRLFTLIPGRLGIALPDGFGIPIYSDEPLDYLSMSLNLNEPNGSRQVRFKTAVSFLRDVDAAKDKPMRPLFRRAVYAYEPIGMESPHTMCSGGDHPGMACGPFIGKSASDSFLASLGKTNTIHWLIPPGHYESRVPINVQLALPYDTTVHYVTGHLHPYGKSVSLFDATTRQVVFQINATDFADRVGVDTMDQIALNDGVLLHKNHDYELVTIYDNPTTQPIDAMSILYLYCLDKKFLTAH